MGEERRLKMNEAFLISGSQNVWFIASGQIEMFAVQIEGDEPVGARTHFGTFNAGSILLGIDFELFGQSSGFLAAGSEVTQVYKLAVEDLRTLAHQREYSLPVGTLINDWLQTLSASVVRDIRPRPKTDEILVGGKQARLPRASVARAKKGIVWVQVMRGEALYLGMEGVSVTGEGVPILPISPETWIEAYDDNVLHSFLTPMIIGQATFWRGIDLFHKTLCQCEFINKKMRMVDEFNRIRLRESFGQRSKEVALREIASVLDWWETDHGPLLAYREQGLAPVAILKNKATDYELVDPETNERRPIDASVAATLCPFAVSFYTPFPEKKLRAWDLIKFGVRESKLDMWTILGMGILLGLLGIVTPYFTGQIFDSIIPAAERVELLQFPVGLLAAAFGTFAFELVRAIAVLRLSGKMDYLVQAGVWDRLLALPSIFFREYTAGDLADRALGVDQIRQAVSQAGTQAIVGIISALIMIAFLFSYNMQMAFVAIGLVVLSVLFPMALNARMSGLDRDIKNMPMGMNTVVVSEGGGTFSGGQRQRLMVARALVNKPRIIFFDEATSALDNETQRTVTDSLDALQSTRIVIAHRLSTIINADKIYVLINGEMVQSGTYAQLINQPGPFADLAKRQLA